MEMYTNGRKCSTPEGNNKTDDWAPMYDEKLRRVRATMLEVKKQLVLHIMCAYLKP